MQSSLFDLIDNNPDENKSEDGLEKDKKVEEAQHRLRNRLSAGNINTRRDKVAWILNHHPETRDSDITLQLKYWETFEPHIYNGSCLNPEDLYRLTRLTDITRERARIQNTYKLFKASDKIRRSRNNLSDEEKEKAIEDRPIGYPSLSVYMDESGKNEDNLIVGSVWLLGGGKPIYEIFRSIRDFKKRAGFKKEFHFSEMRRMDLPIYQEMISLFLREVPAVSFKIASVPTFGIRDKQDAYKQLFYHLLIQGIENEHQTKRAELPRILQVWKDAEEEGADRLIMADLTDRLKQCSATRFDEKLYIGQVECVDSKSNTFIQIADLFTASANRVLNQTNVNRNHKTEFAEFLLDAVRVDKSFSPNDKIGDMVIHISI